MTAEKALALAVEPNLFALLGRSGPKMEELAEARGADGLTLLMPSAPDDDPGLWTFEGVWDGERFQGNWRIATPEDCDEFGRDDVIEGLREGAVPSSALGPSDLATAEPEHGLERDPRDDMPPKDTPETALVTYLQKAGGGRDHIEMISFTGRFFHSTVACMGLVNDEIGFESRPPSDGFWVFANGKPGDLGDDFGVEISGDWRRATPNDLVEFGVPDLLPGVVPRIADAPAPK